MTSPHARIMRFPQVMGCVAAFLFAAWAFILALFVGTLGLVAAGFTVVLAHALVLGLPIFLICWWKRWVNLITCLCGGFLWPPLRGFFQTGR